MDQTPTCAHGHPLIGANLRIVTQHRKDGPRKIRLCETCLAAAAKSPRRRQAKPQDVLARICMLDNQILALADQQDIAGGWESFELRERIRQLRCVRDHLHHANHLSDDDEDADA